MKGSQLFCLICLSFVTTARTAQADVVTRYTLETGMEYYSGNYGTSQHTDIVYIPVTGKVQGNNWSAKWTIPYIKITGTNSVVNQLGQTATGASGNPSVRSGMGDWLLAATRNVHNGGTNGFVVNLTGKVKLATADTAKGLGTGVNDYAIESTLFKPSPDITHFATLGYKIYGSSATYPLHNTIYGSLGSSYKFAQGTNAGAMLIASQKVMENKSNRAEILLFVSHTLGKQWKTQGYVLKGFTNSVPDWGGGILVDYQFEMKRNPASFAMLGAFDA